jgi:GPR180/TMEM145, transmembrane domain
LYDTVPGYILVTFRLVLVVYCLIELKRTYRYSREANQRAFYLFFGIFIIIWLVSLPAIVLVAHLLSAWLRKKIVYGLEGGFRTFFFMVLLGTFSRCSPFYSVLVHGDRVSFGRNKMQIFPEVVEFDSVEKKAGAGGSPRMAFGGPEPEGSNAFERYEVGGDDGRSSSDEDSR